MVPQNCIHHTLVLCPVQFVFFWKCLSLTLHIFNLFLQAPYYLKIFFVRSFKSIEIILKMFSWFIKSAFDGVFDLIGLEFTNSIFLFTSVLESFCTFKCFIFITRSNVTWEQSFKSTERLNTNLSVWLTALHFRIGYLRLRLMWSL